MDNPREPGSSRCQKNPRHTTRNDAMFDFPKIFHLPHFPTPSSNNDMHLSLEELSIGSQEPLSVSEGRMVGSEEVKELWGAAMSLEERHRVKIDAQKTEILRLKGWKERYTRKYRGVKERVAELEREIGMASEVHQKTLEKQGRRTQVMADQLARTEELLATRSAELAVAQSFLSTADGLSEAEVLDIVRDLNEITFQVAANLTDEWEKLGSSRADRFTIDQRDIDDLSQLHGPVLIQQALNRDTVAVTFLVQSCLCSLVTDIVSSWCNHRELARLGPVYQRLSASEVQAISARWRSLTYSYLSQPPPHSASIAEHVAGVLWITGSFSSLRRSLEFVNTVTLRGIETIDRLALRLKFAFMVEVTSSDMSLQSETPHTIFDEATMNNEFGADNASRPGKRDRVAGTTEVGVRKSVCRGPGEGRRTEILSKAKVVLERDVAGS